MSSFFCNDYYIMNTKTTVILFILYNVIISTMSQFIVLFILRNNLNQRYVFIPIYLVGLYLYVNLVYQLSLHYYNWTHHQKQIIVDDE